MKKKTDRDVGAAEASAVPVVSNHAAPPSAGSAIEPMGVDAIRSRILTVRGVHVMLDRDLAELYGVPTKRLNEQVRRNIIRFPSNFMFMLNDTEIQEVFSRETGSGNRSRSQIATLNKGRGHNIKYRPYAFTEHGIIMLASVLRSEMAALVSIRITNAFVEMRKVLSSIAPLLARIETSERRQIADQAKTTAIKPVTKSVSS